MKTAVILKKQGLFLFVLESYGFSKEQTDYEFRPVLDQLTACLYESFSSCQ